MLLLKQHRLLVRRVRRGLAWFGMVWHGSAAEKGKKIKIVRLDFFVWFGLVRQGSVGFRGVWWG